MWLTGLAMCLSALNIVLSITASLGNALILVAGFKDSLLFTHQQNFFPMSCSHWPLCRPYFPTPFCSRDFGACNWDELPQRRIQCYKLYFVWDISLDKRGQTSRPLTDFERQACCDFEARSVSPSFMFSSVGSMQFWSDRAAWFPAIFFGELCLITSIFSYTKIYLTLRQHQAQVIQDPAFQGEPNGRGIPLNVARFKKTVPS